MNSTSDAFAIQKPAALTAVSEPVPFVVSLGKRSKRLNLMVDNVRCAGCIRKIEDALTAIDGVERARVNLSTRRLVVDWCDDIVDPRKLVDTVNDLGFPAAPFDPQTFGEKDKREERRLLTALAVAGFAAANVMLLSVSVWAGHGGGMGWATRDMFHWISAVIALPAVAYAGRPFFDSALAALRARRLNMDVPISLAVILATVMSVHQVAVSGMHAYFDAALGLLFFLLIGRYLDQRARSKARSAAQHLVRLTSTSATVKRANGKTDRVPVDRLRDGMVLLVAAGEALAADGTVVAGATCLDCSLMTGESMPQDVAIGDTVHAGTVNLGQPIEVEITAVGDETTLAEIVRLMESAEQGRAKYVRIADRVARIYAPAVHILSAATFAGWFIVGVGWETSLITAIAVLIITCPCALGLAVPTVQVVATGLLMRHGVLVKSADGLERLSEIDTVVFDKTGTLTLGQPELVNRRDIDDGDLSIASALAGKSMHPLCRALADAGAPLTRPVVNDVSETSGKGIEGNVDGEPVNLGSAAWLGVDRCRYEQNINGEPGSEIWMVRDSHTPVVFRFRDKLRPDAAATVSALRDMGVAVRILSGDRPAIVRSMAVELGIPDEEAEANCLPKTKVERIQTWTANGQRILMVGDGLNDAPALAQGHASMSPSAASDVSRTAADVVFQGQSLMAVANTIRLARSAHGAVRQNFALAFGYNAIAVPLAMAGFVTPLFAAIAMSSSSLVVTMNSLRLKLKRWQVAQ